jgi:hypothetical protein
VTDKPSRVPAVRQSAVLGALTGLALVFIVWGATYVWPSSGQAGVGVSDRSPSPSPSVDSTGAVSSDGNYRELPAIALPKRRPPATPMPSKDAAADGSAASSPPSDGSAASRPVPVRATVTYEIAAKGNVQADLESFAAEVADILADPKGWPGAGIEFKRVQSGGLITIWLTEDSQVPSFSPICSTGLSCSIDRNIIINELRWVESAPAGVMDDVPVEMYRAMVVNHEVGHWLGHHNHSSCPGPGEIAPLMMQQSKGLHGCIFNQYPLPSEMVAPDLFG